MPTRKRRRAATRGSRSGQSRKSQVPRKGIPRGSEEEMGPAEI